MVLSGRQKIALAIVLAAMAIALFAYAAVEIESYLDGVPHTRYD